MNDTHKQIIGQLRENPKTFNQISKNVTDIDVMSLLYNIRELKDEDRITERVINKKTYYGLNKKFRKQHRYTEEENNYIRESVKQGLTFKEIGIKLNLSANKINAQALRLGIRKVKPYKGRGKYTINEKLISNIDRPIFVSDFAGLIGFDNQKSKSSYISRYIRFARKYKNKYNLHIVLLIPKRDCIIFKSTEENHIEAYHMMVERYSKFLRFNKKLILGKYISKYFKEGKSLLI